MRLPLLRITLRHVLAYLTKATLKKHRPIIIFVKGDKHTSIISSLLYRASLSKYNPRKSLERTEREFSIPLTVLGYLYYPRNFFDWIKILAKSTIQLFWVRPYQHLLIIEIREITTDIYKFWLNVIEPNLIIDVENFSLREILDIQESVIPKKLEQILSRLRITAKEAKEYLKEVTPPSNRISVIPLKNDGTLIDARYFYNPPSLESVLEAESAFEGNRYLLTSKKLNTKDIDLLNKFQTTLLNQKSFAIHEIVKTPYVISIIGEKNEFEKELDLLIDN